jgi:hypothetical protein
MQRKDASRWTTTPAPKVPSLLNQEGWRAERRGGADKRIIDHERANGFFRRW